MRRIKNIILLFFVLLSLCLNLSCELIYDQSPGRIILIGVGLDYINDDGTESNIDINGNAGLENPPNDIREIAYAFSHFASKSNKDFIYIPMIQQKNLSTPVDNYPVEQNLDNLFNELKNNQPISAKVYDGAFDTSTYNLVSPYVSFGSEITSIEPINKNDLIIFYYSGHGDQTNDGDLRIPDDSDMNNIDIGERESISLTWLSESLSALDCNVLAVIDSCGSGSLIEESNLSVNTDITSFVDTFPSLVDTFFSSENENISNSNLFVLTSALPDQLSFDTSKIDSPHINSMFTYYMLQSLGYQSKTNSMGTFSREIPALNNGRISIDSIFDYIDGKIKRQKPLISGGRKTLTLFDIN